MLIGFSNCLGLHAVDTCIICLLLLVSKILAFEIHRDTAGQERFRSLIPSYIRDSSVAVIVYDVGSE